MAVTANWKPVDELFFAEWKSREPGASRSLNRASLVAENLGIADLSIPVLSVVGSKGKGTASTYASATLAGSGLTTVTVTSPPLIENNERIRLNGTQISDKTLEILGREIRSAADRVKSSGDGYLSPTGSYTIAGALFASQIGADALILEEGLGGSSDEISLFSPLVVAATEIFLEHQDLLGGNIKEIASDLLGVAGRNTEVVYSVQQSVEVEEILASLNTRVSVNQFPPAEILQFLNWPRGLSRLNAILGVSSGLEFLKLLDKPLISEGIIHTINSVQMLGRLSSHLSDRGSNWVVDGAINGKGVFEAVRQCKEMMGPPDLVLASFPDSKNVRECYEALAGLNVVPVSVGETYLDYKSNYHPQKPVHFHSVVERFEDDYKCILAVGTMSFVGEVVGYLHGDNSVAFSLK